MRERTRKSVAAILTIIVVCAIAGIVAGCAPQPRAESNEPEGYSENVEQDMTVPAEFAMDNNCNTCHAKSAEGMTHAGFTGALHENISCITCHNGEEELAAAHANNFDAKNADRVVALVKTKVSEDVCYTCHEDMQGLAQTTAASTLLTDEHGTTVNPHNLPENHFGGYVDCGSCHKMHSDKDTDTASKNTCLNCHHDDVYECGTCHAV